MAVDFKVYEGGVELESAGTLTSLAGAKGQLRFTNKSLKGDGLLCVAILRKDGTSGTVTASKVVSANIRKAMENGATKQQCLKAIASLDILEAPNGGNYISQPKGDAEIEFFTVESLAKDTTMSYEALVAF